MELVRVWELERVSGQKHHFWPLYTPARAEAFLGALLAEEGLTLADISAAGAPPACRPRGPIPVPAGAECFPVHSLAHLFSGLMTDTALFKQEKIVAMAMDALPDYVQDGGPTRLLVRGRRRRRGAPSPSPPVESPAPLYAAARTLFGQEPGTLMALASASTHRVRFDAEAAVAGSPCTAARCSRGRRPSPWCGPSWRRPRPSSARYGSTPRSRAEETCAAPP